MKCRYCAENLHIVNEKLFSSYGEKCLGNPAGFHMALSDGSICVYCGNLVKSKNYKPYTKYGTSCKNSPTGMHCLQ